MAQDLSAALARVRHGPGVTDLSVLKDADGGRWGIRGMRVGHPGDSWEDSPGSEPDGRLSRSANRPADAWAESTLPHPHDGRATRCLPPLTATPNALIPRSGHRTHPHGVRKPAVPVEKSDLSRDFSGDVPGSVERWRGQYVRFHRPLVEPNRRVSRIRLSGRVRPAAVGIHTALRGPYGRGVGQWRRVSPAPTSSRCRASPPRFRVLR